MIGLLVGFLACGSPPPPPAPAPPLPPAPPPASGDLHEWGLIDVARDGTARITAEIAFWPKPGAPRVPVSVGLHAVDGTIDQAAPDVDDVDDDQTKVRWDIPAEGTPEHLTWSGSVVLPNDAFPLQITAEAGGARVVNPSHDEIAGELFSSVFVIRRGPTRADTRVAGHLVHPGGNELFVPKDPLDYGTIRLPLSSPMVRFGLDLTEMSAFDAAYETWLCGDEAGRPAAPAAQPALAANYWLPESVIDRLVPIETTPPAEHVERAFLVRIALE